MTRELTTFVVVHLEPFRALVGGERIEELAEALAAATIELGAAAPPRRGEEQLSYESVACMRDTLVRQSPTLRALAESSAMASLRAASLMALDEPDQREVPRLTESPQRLRWRVGLRRELGRELQVEGLQDDEIRWILADGLMGWWGILENLWRLYKVMRAYERARATVGAPPPP
ncbi:hypothetical protein [Paraliomyxa miuraensis]|uniref:hypothetical protein n=1 Tax=Paraliomyxa miuraensis TaxID=376150 RepID=UPI00224DED03|nr:hypothetical protein [Paraliomyxa miuraensis]MCX4242178.1 hypothetical protein [Paraliomyxa miuraensis]